MRKKLLIQSFFILAILWTNVPFADETDINTTVASGGNQIIVSPLNMLIDIGETAFGNALVMDEAGDPVEGHQVHIIRQDEATISISNDSFVTNSSGYINFSILGKEETDTVVTVTDGVISTHINVAVRNLIQFVLPYFYGDMKLSIINPTEESVCVKMQFHENNDRQLAPVTIMLKGKEKRYIKLSEEMDTTLQDGWVEIMSTELICGGVWTNKGYLSINRMNE